MSQGQSQDSGNEREAPLRPAAAGGSQAPGELPQADLRGSLSTRQLESIEAASLRHGLTFLRAAELPDGRALVACREPVPPPGAADVEESAASAADRARLRTYLWREVVAVTGVPVVLTVHRSGEGEPYSVGAEPIARLSEKLDELTALYRQFVTERLAQADGPRARYAILSKEDREHLIFHPEDRPRLTLLPPQEDRELVRSLRIRTYAGLLYDAANSAPLLPEVAARADDPLLTRTADILRAEPKPDRARFVDEFVARFRYDERDMRSYFQTHLFLEVWNRAAAQQGAEAVLARVSPEAFSSPLPLLKAPSAGRRIGANLRDQAVGAAIDDLLASASPELRRGIELAQALVERVHPGVADPRFGPFRLPGKKAVVVRWREPRNEETMRELAELFAAGSEAKREVFTVIQQLRLTIAGATGAAWEKLPNGAVGSLRPNEHTFLRGGVLVFVTNQLIQAGLDRLARAAECGEPPDPAPIKSYLSQTIGASGRLEGRNLIVERTGGTRRGDGGTGTVKSTLSLPEDGKVPWGDSMGYVAFALYLFGDLQAQAEKVRAPGADEAANG